MTEEQTLTRARMSDHARERDDERESRASMRQAIAEIAVSLALIVGVSIAFGLLEIGRYGN